ncbi:COG4705 family protein [Alicyclobacillus sp. ALC3]|uniref:COG4705 family protein n=1 Tax=Alicyclobacillus sp. ALC3 TaxID=2796143 RepID=UPI0023783DD0|nr:hypothetical protein [Alicyclobacillus sp. ALC3]
MSLSSARRGPNRSQSYVKVPEVTGYFWVIKLLTTAMGEALSDFLVYHMNPFVAVFLGAAFLAGAFILQFRVRRYIASVYWLVVLMVAIFGTMVADATHIALGVPYWLSSLVFMISVAVVLTTWHKVERTLSIHSITTRRREAFYWLTVLCTFALGTAAGDMTASTFHLGFLTSGILFTVVFAIPAVGFLGFRWNEVFSFWFAYILTRPVGASFADWISVPHSMGGLGLGKGPVAAYLFIPIVLLVAYLTVSQRDVGKKAGAPRSVGV